MSIGDRIAHGDKRGTIRFIGEVPPFIGTWYGVDWDCPNDGKHDGTYKGIRYFNATYPKSGSFMKSTEAHFGYLFVDALREQYDYDIVKARQDYEENMKDFAIVVFDFANLEKVKRLQSALDSLQVVNLASYHIRGPGEDGEIQKVCPSIMDLDLSNNLMTTWTSVAAIAKQLKNLISLSLNDSRLRIPENPKQYASAFTKLKHMFLCRTTYTWDDILNLAEMWPQIQTLKVPFSNIDSLSAPEVILQNLSHIDIQGNLIYRWSEICKLGHLPRLEILNACATGISEIVLPQKEKLFLKLHTLYVAENYIKSVVDIADLNNFPSLKDLRVNKNPLTSDDKYLSYREKIIARIADLKVLNGHEIEPDERRCAEYEYLKDYAKDWFLCSSDEKEKEKFLFENPRYLFLVKKYGAVEVPVEVEPSLKSHLITVNLVYVTRDGLKETIKKKVHISLAVYKLIAIAKRSFNISSGTLSLVRISSKNTAIKVEMSDNLKLLNSYAVEDEDTIYVNHSE